MQYTRSKKGPPVGVGGKQSHLQHNFKTQAMRRSSGEWGLWLRSLTPYISTRVVVVGGGGCKREMGTYGLRRPAARRLFNRGNSVHRRENAQSTEQQGLLLQSAAMRMMSLGFAANISCSTWPQWYSRPAVRSVAPRQHQTAAAWFRGLGLVIGAGAAAYIALAVFLLYAGVLPAKPAICSGSQNFPFLGHKIPAPGAGAGEKPGGGAAARAPPTHPSPRAPSNGARKLP
jgi:hypothetical protein